MLAVRHSRLSDGPRLISGSSTSYHQRFAHQVPHMLPRWPSLVHDGPGRFRPLLTSPPGTSVSARPARRAVARLRPRAAGGRLSLAWISRPGVVADAVQSLYLLAPFALVLWLLPDRAYARRRCALACSAGAFVWMFGLTFVRRHRILLLRRIRRATEPRRRRLPHVSDRSGRRHLGRVPGGYGARRGRR